MTEVQQINKPEEKKKADVKALYNDKFVGNFTRKELDTLRATIARGTNDEEFGLFVQTCVNTGLNPFLNHIHCMVYDGQRGRTLSIQISAEGVLYLARKTDGFNGVDVQMVHENDEFEIDLATKKILAHKIGFPRGRIIGSYAIARHKHYEDKIMLMDATEVEHLKKGKNSHMWNTWFPDMFKKHIMKRICKEQYGIDVTEEEVQNAPIMDALAEKPNRIEVAESEFINEEDKLQEMWEEIESNVPGEIIANVMKTYFKGKSEQDLELKDVAALRKFCQLELHKQNKKSEKVEEPEVIEMEPEQPKTEIDEFNSFFD